jgi:hypothetical protein
MAVVPQTVRGAEGLVEGEASDENPCPRRAGHGGDVDELSPSAAGASDALGPKGRKSAAENRSEILGRFLRAEVNSAYSAFSARIRAFSSRVSFS